MERNLALAGIAEPLAHPSLAHEPLIDVLRLARTPRVGPITLFHLVRRFGSARAALERLPEMAQRSGGALQPCSVEVAEKEHHATTQFGATLVRYGEAAYPALLARVADPPPILAVSGNASLWQRPCVGMVGARNASANACALARKLAAELAEAGTTVVSGLARGIDTAVHHGALKHATVGIIAGGIDTVYPPENAALYQEMRARGAIVSEQPFAAAPFAGAFPSRNRIIAGMCQATVVVEASPKSGSLITARLAGEYGREVCAVPGFPLDPRAQGCNSLLKQGATLVENASDVLEALRATPRGMEEAFSPPFTAPTLEPDDAMLAHARERVLEALGATPTPLDALAAACGLTHGMLFTVLIELELAGRARQTGGGVCAVY